jgi:hypothetical protein
MGLIVVLKRRDAVSKVQRSLFGQRGSWLLISLMSQRTAMGTKLGPLCKDELLKNGRDKLVVRSPENAALYDCP